MAALKELVTGPGTGSRIYGSILKGLLSSLLAAFQFSPSSLSSPDLESFRQIMAGIYSGVVHQILLILHHPLGLRVENSYMFCGLVSFL